MSQVKLHQNNTTLQIYGPRTEMFTPRLLQHFSMKAHFLGLSCNRLRHQRISCTASLPHSPSPYRSRKRSSYLLSRIAGTWSKGKHRETNTHNNKEKSRKSLCLAIETIWRDCQRWGLLHNLLWKHIPKPELSDGRPAQPIGTQGGDSRASLASQASFLQPFSPHTLSLCFSLKHALLYPSPFSFPLLHPHSHIQTYSSCLPTRSEGIYVFQLLS